MFRHNDPKINCSPNRLKINSEKKYVPMEATLLNSIKEKEANSIEPQQDKDIEEFISLVVVMKATE